MVASAVLLVMVWRTDLQQPDVSLLLLVALILGICLSILFVAGLSLHLRRGHRETAKVLETREREFQQMADNIEEIFWTIDAESKKALYVTQAYETITGRSCRSLMENPYSYEELIHPDDRVPVLAKLEEATRTGQFHERFRIVLPRGEVRWVSVHGFPVRDGEGRIWRLVGTARDVTAQKQAEEQVASHLALAESAWAESEALRKATLALTQDLRMDFVLDALLQSLTELISCECARIWLLEGETRLFVAREKLRHETQKKTASYPLTLDAADIPFLHRILGSQKSILLADTKQEADWQAFKSHAHLRSWLCVPLVASQRTLGLLTAGHAEPESFTREDLRRAQLLAIPAAAAIQNSRLYECASIYGSELEKRINDLHEAKNSLEQSEESRKVSEDKFQKVFHSNPVAFSITTVNEGLFLDVNAAFECRHGYSRSELIGHTVHELKMWEDPADRSFMVAQLQRGGQVRSVITRLRTKSGHVKLTSYSADEIQFDGHTCILAVSEDVPSYEPRLSN